MKGRYRSSHHAEYEYPAYFLWADPAKRGIKTTWASLSLEDFADEQRPHKSISCGVTKVQLQIRIAYVLK
jgi:hypothetical protein